MEIYSHRDYTYVEKEFNLSLNDFEIERSDIYMSSNPPRYYGEITLVPKDENIIKATEAIGLDPERVFKETYHHAYDYRGRRTDEHYDQADREARAEFKKKFSDTNYFAEKLFAKVKDRIEGRLAYQRTQYIESLMRTFTNGDPIKWDKLEDEELKKRQAEYDRIDEKIKKLRKERSRLKEGVITRKNILFLRGMEKDKALEKAFKQKFPTEFKIQLRENAAEGKLFRPTSLHPFE